MPRRSVSQGQEGLGLPAQQLVGEPLERLAHHHERAGVRVAGAEVQVGQPPLPAAMAPLGPEHHQVIGLHRLDLAPRLAAPPRRVHRGGVLDDDALVARGDRLVEHALGLAGVAGEDARDPVGRRDLLQPSDPLVQRRVQEILAVDVQDVEQERDDPLRRGAAVDLGDRVLKRSGALSVHPDGLAVQHRLADRQPADRGDDPGQGLGDLVEVAGVDADLVAAAVDLDADPVELELHRRALEPVQRLGHVRAGGGQHREDRPEDLESDRAQTPPRRR